MKHRRALLAILGGWSLLSACSPSPRHDPPPTRVRCEHPVACVEGGFPGAGRSYLAVVKADVETDLSFKVGGILDSIHDPAGRPWPEGVPVGSNQVLARLAPADFTNALRSAAARAELEAKRYVRAALLAHQQVISSNEFDVIVASRQEAEAQLAQARQNEHDSVLRAPYSGTVLERRAEAGETIAPGQTVLRLGDLRQVSLELGVPDTQIGRVSTQSLLPVVVSALEGSGQSFTGRVTEVGVAAKARGRLFKVVLKVPNPEGRIKAGMTARVSLEATGRLASSAVLVPLSALVPRSLGQGAPTRWAVFVLEADRTGYRARERAVETDDIARNSILVTAGLGTNDWVVVSGAGALADGAPVAPVQDTP